jgi:hypothetical protein
LFRVDIFNLAGGYPGDHDGVANGLGWRFLSLRSAGFSSFHDSAGDDGPLPRLEEVD